jgi:hypothetical protein
MTVESVEFMERKNAVSDAALDLMEATNVFNEAILALRELCPHLMIAACQHTNGGRELRVCEHCGIQEIQWYSAFRTLTTPGGTYYETLDDKSKDRRNGAQPVLTLRSSYEVYSYRRGPHLDVTEI